LLTKAVQDYQTALLKPFHDNRDFWKEEIRILTDYEVVNGVAGKRYLGGMNMSSAFDPRMPGPKSKYAKQFPDGHWEFDSFVMDEYNKRLKQMKEGIVTNEIYMQCLKNEATPDHKIEAGKVRSFYMSGTVTQMIIRKYLLTTCRYYCFTTDYSETMVGINPHDDSWDKFCREFYSRGKDYMMALDFKSFDLTSLFEVVSSSIKTLLLPLRTAMKLREESEDTINEINNVLNSITHLLLYSMLVVGGEVVVLQAIIASGSNLTSMLGSTVNSINYRMAFFHIFKDIDKAFRDCVTLRTFGDDSLSNTTQEFKKFNAVNVLGAWKEFGIPATGIEKTDIGSRKFYRQNELEFLKRKMIYSKDFKAYIAPLDYTSMFKCLCCHVPSKAVSIEHLTGQCTDNFLFEARYHGRKFYNKAQAILRRLLNKHDLLRYSNAIDITYDEHIKNWRALYSKEQVTDEVDSGYVEKVRHFLEDIFNPQKWLYSTQNSDNNMFIVQDRSHVKAVVAPDRAHITRQSGNEVSSQKEKTVTFVDAEAANSLNVGGSLPPGRLKDKEVELVDFLARPVKIADVTWGNSGISVSGGTAVLDPWTALWYNKRVSNKIATYANFRSNMRVKMVINGNSFFYGKLMVTYLPFYQIDAVTHKTPGALGVLTTSSQCPKVFLDPTLSEGAEMTLPWFYHTEYLNITTSTIVADSPGALTFHVVNPLKNVNEDLSVSLTTITISVYAWFENAELEGATVTNPAFMAPQSGREDETHKKPVSQFCTAVADASSVIAKVPVIAPYARAVEEGARVGSKLASALGYSKPVDVAENLKNTPRNTNNMALANTVDDVCKFTVDAKQELSIDPRLSGLGGEDELSFARICSIPTYLTTALWTTQRDIKYCLLQVNVHPYMWAAGPDSQYALTACGGVGIHFKYWTGTMEFMFQVASSAFHRGRLLVVYDPRPSSVAIDSPEENAHYSWVVDLAETRNFKVSISNYRHTDWLEITDTVLTDIQYIDGDTPTLAQNKASNGKLSIYVLNKLTVPSNSNGINTDIGINMYVNGGSDLKFATPRNTGIRRQSGVEATDKVGTQETTNMGTPENNLRHYKSVKYIGEEIDSFRTLIKRYQHYLSISKFTFSSDYLGYYLLVHQMYPVKRPSNGVYPHDVSGFMAVNNLIRLLMQSFSGYKGSMRWKASVNGDVEFNSIMFGRTDSIAASEVQHTVPNPDSAIESSAYRAFMADQIYNCGGTLQSVDMNNVMSSEIPFYSKYSFIPGKKGDRTSYNEMYETNSLIMLLPYRGGGSTKRIYIDLWTAAGEDFTCMFFTGWPLMEIIAGVVE
jgi:hypothetical protein